MDFFDTYALYQIARGCESYALFKKHILLTTTLLNLYEFYYVLCKDGEEQLAESFFERLLPFCLEITPEDIKESAKFRLANSRKKFSYADALGYTMAMRRDFKFVTGDDAFKELDNVVFIK